MDRIVRTLPTEFYLQPTIDVARALIGKILVVRGRGGKDVGFRITETEAYLGVGDEASHSHLGPTPRNRAMFGVPGTVYVYVSYGIHRCLNVVTQPIGVGEAVLLRAGEILWGGDIVRRRRGVGVAMANLANGPGKMGEGLGVDLRHNGASFQGPVFWLGEGRDRVAPKTMVTGRIGISRASDLPYRFVAVPGIAGLRRATCE